eukprot:g19201.t1
MPKMRSKKKCNGLRATIHSSDSTTFAISCGSRADDNDGTRDDFGLKKEVGSGRTGTLYHPWMVIDLGEPMTVLGVQVQRRSGYDLMNNNEFVSIVRVSTSLIEPRFPPVNWGLGAYGSRLRPGGTLTASQQTAAERVAESQKGINGMLASGGAASASASASATAAGAQQASATASAVAQAQPSSAFLEHDGGGSKVAPDRGESRRSDDEFQLSRILNETAAASFLEESEKRDVKIHDVIYDGTTLQAAPYQKGGMETTLFWIGYDIDARGWADVRLRDSVLARYVKVTAVECKNHCSMRARVRVLSRAGCFTESFYMVS